MRKQRNSKKTTRAKTGKVSPAKGNTLADGSNILSAGNSFDRVQNWGSRNRQMTAMLEGLHAIISKQLAQGEVFATPLEQLRAGVYVFEQCADSFSSAIAEAIVEAGSKYNRIAQQTDSNFADSKLTSTHTTEGAVLQS